MGQSFLLLTEFAFIKRTGILGFGKEDKDIVEESFYKSFEYAKDIISKYIADNGYKMEDVIIFGRSQGGFMGICLGIELGVGKIIAMAADINVKFVNADKAKTAPKIIWIEAGQDEYINAERRKSYKDLQKLGFNVDYRLAEDAEHNKFDLSIVDSV